VGYVITLIIVGVVALVLWLAVWIMRRAEKEMWDENNENQ